MNIDYFNYLYDLKGISIGSYIKGLELMTALEKRGHCVNKHWRLEREPVPAVEKQVRPLRTAAKRYLHRYLHEANQCAKNVRFYREEKQIIEHDQPDLLIARLESYLFSPRIIRKKYNIPFIAEADSPVVYELDHFGPTYVRVPGVAEKLQASFINSADAAFCVSSTMKKYFVDCGVPEQHLTVITNGADLSRFNPDISSADVVKKYGLEHKTVIGFLGSFHLWHGVDQLIKLIRTVVSQNSDTVFLLVGSGGPMHEELKEFSRSEGFKNRIILTGYVEHDMVSSYISAMDIVLAPYPALDFFYYSPVKIFEYMACGKAVVTSDIGQIAEVITNGTDGILCTPGDTGEMITAVKELAGNTQRIQKLGSSAYAKIERNYSWDRKAAELEKLCEVVMHRK